MKTTTDTVTLTLTPAEFFELELIVVDHDVDCQEFHEPVRRKGQIVLTLHVNDAKELTHVFADHLAALEGDQSASARKLRELTSAMLAKITEVL